MKSKETNNKTNPYAKRYQNNKRRKTNVEEIPASMSQTIENIPKDVMIDVLSYLDAISIVRFLRTTKRFWNLITNSIVDERISPYRKYIKYQQWNKGLKEATKRNHFPQIVFFVEQGADSFDECGLQEASFQGNRVLVDYFIKMGATDFRVALLEAAKGGHKDLVEFFVNKTQEEDKLEYGLKGACKGNHMDLVHYFLNKMGRNVNSLFAVAYAAGNGNQEMINLLLPLCNPHLQLNALSLCYASEGGHKDIVEFFWERETHASTVLNYALRLASKGGHKHIIEWILQRITGSEWPVRGLEGATAGGNMELIKFFEDKGASDWNRGLIAAAKYGHLELVKYFLDKGADDLTQALVASNNDEVTELLIKKGA